MNRLLFILLCVLCVGCSRRAKTAAAIYFVPGVAGDGMWYNGLRAGLRDAGEARPIITVSWGAPGPLFAMNFSNAGIHDDAEQKLANILKSHAEKFDQEQIVLLGHSAGCGVILGAMRKLPHDARVDQIILVAPSVSPQYDISAALQKSGSVDAFVSSRDTTFLSWRTSNFGSYDNIKTRAAGNAGFLIDRYSPAELTRFRQHPYDPAWNSLGNDGGHFGGVSRRFVASNIALLLQSGMANHPR